LSQKQLYQRHWSSESAAAVNTATMMHPARKAYVEDAEMEVRIETHNRVASSPILTGG